jgi:hypothetical protein
MGHAGAARRGHMEAAGIELHLSAQSPYRVGHEIGPQDPANCCVRIDLSRSWCWFLRGIDPSLNEPGKISIVLVLNL